MSKKQAKSIPILDVIDAYNWLNRAYFSAPKLTTKAGEPTGAVKGFVNMVNSLVKKRIEKYGVCYLVVAFDSNKGKNWRHQYTADFLSKNRKHIGVMPTDTDKGYKGTRLKDETKSSELNPQIELAKQILTARGIVCLESPKYEADDIIGTLAVGASPTTYNLMIWSRDKDFAQLLSRNVRITQQAQGNTNELVVTRMNCKEVYGILPKHVIPYLAMCGDKSDNVPGIPGIGPAKAVELIALHENSDDLMSSIFAGTYTKGLQKKLTDPINQKLYYMSETLVSICTDVPDVPTDLRKYRLGNLSNHSKQLSKLAKRWEFTQLFTV